MVLERSSGFGKDFLALVSRICQAMGCLGCCFGFRRKSSKCSSKHTTYNVAKGGASQECLLTLPEEALVHSCRKSTKNYVGQGCSASDGRELQGLHGWHVGNENDELMNGNAASIKITSLANTSQDHEGNKMINQYVRENKIGIGSYGKVVLHRNLLDNKLYAIKIFHKSRLRRIRVAPCETAMMDVLREVDIMKQLNHPNVIRLVEVIDDEECDHFYMVLEYMEGERIFEGPGPAGGLGEDKARKYFKDIVTGLKYLHSRKVVHGDIKPENLMVSREGRVKIGDFGVSRTFQGEDDLLRRSPGTPVFTAPECCKGLVYHGRVADVWALGVTLYCMVLGQYPFVGESFQETYDKIIEQDLYLPTTLQPDLRDLLERLLCKDPESRITLDAVENHPWFLQEHCYGC